MLIYLNATLVTIRGKKTDYCLFIAPMSCDNIFLEMGRSPGHLTLNRDGVNMGYSSRKASAVAMSPAWSTSTIFSML